MALSITIFGDSGEAKLQNIESSCESDNSNKQNKEEVPDIFDSLNDHSD